MVKKVGGPAARAHVAVSMVATLTLVAAIMGLETPALRLEAGTFKLKAPTIRLRTAAFTLRTRTLRLETGAFRSRTPTLRLETGPFGVKTATLRLRTVVIDGITAAIGLETATLRLKAAILALMPPAIDPMTVPITLIPSPLGPMPRPMSLSPVGLDLIPAALQAKPAILGLTCVVLRLVSPCSTLMTSPDSTGRRRLPATDGAFDDEGAPISEPRPSSPAPDAGILDRGVPSNDIDAPLPPDAAAIAADDAGVKVTRELTYAFLAKKATRDRIREVVVARVPSGAQEGEINDIIQEASLRALETTSLARSAAGLRPWISRIAQNQVIDHYRGNAKHLRWLNRSIDVQELPRDAATEGDEAEVPAADPTAPPRPIEELNERMLGAWLQANVETKGEKLTFEMMKQKATTLQTNAEVAAEFGMTEGALDQRVQRFKAKWIPRWKKHKRDQALLVVALFLGLLLAGALWWLLHGKTQDAIEPAAVPVLSPAPTASVAPPEQFNNADPTQEQEGKKPQRVKP
jgi:DNA-directed RNA polymerase specialized sigma24 family protein